MAEYYTQLGVTMGATPLEIKRAFRTAMLGCHPDKRGDKDSQEAVAVIQAYKVLTNQQTKAEYDCSLKAEMRKVQRHFQVGQSHPLESEGEIECEQCQGITDFEKVGQAEEWLVSCAHCGASIKVQ